MPLLPNRGPPLPATHQPVPIEELFALRNVLRAAAPDGKLSFAIIEAVAAQEGVPRSKVFAAVAVDPNLQLPMQAPTVLAVCVGGCQAQGALDIADQLITLRASRERAGKVTFDLVPRNCLDLCAHSPAAMARSASGMAALPRLRPEDLPGIIDQLCD